MKIFTGKIKNDRFHLLKVILCRFVSDIMTVTTIKRFLKLVALSSLKSWVTILCFVLRSSHKGGEKKRLMKFYGQIFWMVKVASVPAFFLRRQSADATPLCIYRRGS